MRKSFTIKSLIKGTTNFAQKPSIPRRKASTIDTQENVDKCLNCTKPESQCKGNCFGKY